MTTRVPAAARIGMRQRGLILRPREDSALAWSWARREPDSAGVPNGAGAPPYSHNNARADKLGGWPWRAAQRQRRLIPVSGFREPEKRAQEKGAAPWSYYNLKHGQPFLMVGLWSDAPDPATGEVADSYTLVIGEANAATRVQLSAAATVSLGAHAVFRPWEVAVGICSPSVTPANPPLSPCRRSSALRSPSGQSANRGPAAPHPPEIRQEGPPSMSRRPTPLPACLRMQREIVMSAPRDNVAVVAGGSSVVGRVAAPSFAKKGAKVLNTARRAVAPGAVDGGLRLA